MSTGGSLLKGSIFRTVDLVVLVGASFILTPYLVHSLGDRIYGFWTIVGSLMGYYGLLDFGLSSAAARYLSQAMGKEDAGELDRVASTAWLLFCAMGGLILAVTAVSVAACPRFVSATSDVALFQELLVIMGAATAASFVAKTYLGMLTAGIRYDLIAAVSIARTLACNVGIYFCLRAGRGLIAVAVATLVVGLLHCAALYAAFRSRFPRVRLSLRVADAARVRSMLGYGSKTLVCQLGDILRFRLDTVLIASLLSASLVTPYAVGTRLIEGFAQLVLSSVGMMLPVFSQYEGRGDYEAIRSALLKVTRLSTILTVFVGASLIFYGRAFILRWMGPGFDSAYVVAAILGAGFMLDLPQSPGIQLLYGLSKQEVYAYLSVAEGVANLILSLLFLKRWGIYGVALGTTVEFAVFKLFIQPVYICRAVGLPVRAYLLDAILLTTLKTAAPLALFFFVVHRFVAPSYSDLAACVAAQTALFAPAAYFLIMGRPERQAVGNALRALGTPAPAGG